MDTTYADVADGNRVDIAVEFVTRRTVDCEGERVHRLLVADRSGRRFTVLATPDSEPPLDLKTGGEHRISGLLGAVPVTAADGVKAECPDCGGALRPGQVVDAAGPAVGEAASELSLDETFGIVDASATIRRVREHRTLADDWTPGAGDGSVAPPELVCEACGRHLDAHELRDATGFDRRSNR